MKKHRSQIQKTLLKTIKIALPNYRVLEEYYIGEGLYLDVFLPDFSCGIELHGSQHYEFSPFYHTDASGWSDQQRRDSRKLEICAREEITFIVIKYDDPIDDVDWVRDKILEEVVNDYRV